MKTAIYPGSFDPITNGHLSIMLRASQLFDKVIVAVLKNSSKSPTFTAEERVDLIKTVLKDNDVSNVEVISFSGLLADCCKEVGAKHIVKGLRALSDFEYEFQMALTNKKINDAIETIFFTTEQEYMYLSSSIVKEVAKYGGDIEEFVPRSIVPSIVKKLGAKGE